MLRILPGIHDTEYPSGFQSIRVVARIPPQMSIWIFLCVIAHDPELATQQFALLE
jgi:hypothetical protein